MASTVSNCRKCNRIFQKRVSDLCPECIVIEEEQFKILYRTLQKSATQGGIPIDALSDEVGIPVEDIERFYLEGRLSTAGSFLQFQCQACGLMMSAKDRKGRYCLKCSELTASKAGVEVRSRQEIEKAEAEEKKRQQQMSLLKQNRVQDTKQRTFGGYRSRSI